MGEFSFLEKDGSLKTYKIQGHLVLTRRCKSRLSQYLIDAPVSRPELGSHVADIEKVLETWSEDKHENWYEVLAVGDKCSTKRNESELKSFRMEKGKSFTVPRHVNNPLKEGDFVLLPELALSNKKWRGVTGNEYDVIIDEAELIAFIDEQGMIKPFGMNVLIETDSLKKMDGDFEIPDIGVERPNTGTVINLGTGTSGVLDFDVNVGESVLFSMVGERNAKMNGRDCRILSTDKILGVFDE